MKKKTLSLALALVMCLGLTVPAFADDSGFDINDGVLTGYSGPGGDVVIPDGVTSIGEEAFAFCETLTSVTIPEGVTSIGVNAFLNCHSLASVTFPSSLTSIEDDAFVGCFSLDGVVIPSSVTSIGAGVFSYSGVTSVTIPSSVTSIGHTAFSYCASLTSLTFPSSITSISEYMFDSSEYLTSVTIPSSVTSIGEYAFSQCENLTDIYYTGSEEQWSAIEIDEKSGLDLTTVTIHYNSGTTQPEQPTPVTAMPTNDRLEVNGAAAEPTVYKIGGANYFKIRDLAALLNGTEKQFSVNYDSALSAVTVATGEGYARLDTDLAGAAAGGDQTAIPSNDTIYINGEKADAEVYKIGGANYFKLRDLGKALDFYVGWTAERGMYIETDKGYSE